MVGWWDGSGGWEGKGASCRAWDPYSVKKKTNEWNKLSTELDLCTVACSLPHTTHTHKIIINFKLSNFLNTHLKNLLRFLVGGSLNIHYLFHELVPNNTFLLQWKNRQALSEKWHHKWFSCLHISLDWNLEGRARRGICAPWRLWRNFSSRSHLSEINTVGLISG